MTRVEIHVITADENVIADEDRDVILVIFGNGRRFKLNENGRLREWIDVSGWGEVKAASA